MQFVEGESQCKHSIFMFAIDDRVDWCRTDVRLERSSDGRTDVWTDGRTDVRLLLTVRTQARAKPWCVLIRLFMPCSFKSQKIGKSQLFFPQKINQYIVILLLL